MNDLLKTLAERGIEPIGAEGAHASVHTEHWVVSSVSKQASEPEARPPDFPPKPEVAPPVVEPPSLRPLKPGSVSPPTPPTPPIGPRRNALLFSNYEDYSGPPWNDPGGVDKSVVSENIVRIVEVEGPVFAKRAYEIYLRKCGNLRMNSELKSTMNKALAHAINQRRLGIEYEVEGKEGGFLLAVIRVNGSPSIKLRTRGSRSFEEIPPSELQYVARYLVKHGGFTSGSDEHLSAILERFDLGTLTKYFGSRQRLREILARKFPYVDELLDKDIP